MRKSIALYCNAEISFEEKIRVFNSVGFDEFFTSIDDKKENICFAEQVKIQKQLGMDGNMVHCHYYEPNLNFFWEKGQIGEDICNDYIRQIEKLGGACKNFVVHFNGDNGVSRQTKIGIKRIKKILKACEKYDTNLCIENLHSAEELPYIFEHINHKNLKICYDTGHKNFLTPNLQICETLGKYVAVLHIHENNGKKDEHKPLTIGGEMFKRLVKELKLVDNNIVLSAEIKIGKDNFYETIKQTYKSLCELDKQINQD